MDRRHLVPDHDVVDRPVVAVVEPRLGEVLEEEAQQRVALLRLEVDDDVGVAGVDEQRRAAGHGMADDDRMDDPPNSAITPWAAHRRSADA